MPDFLGDGLLGLFREGELSFLLGEGDRRLLRVPPDEEPVDRDLRLSRSRGDCRPLLPDRFREPLPDL